VTGIRAGPAVTSRYATVGDLRVAYEVRGSGPMLVMAGTSFTNQEALLDDPGAAMFIKRLARFSTLVRFDVVGVGGSDRPPAGQEVPSLSDQLLAVLDAADAQEVTLMAILQGGPKAIEFVVRNPDRVAGLILWNSTARILRDDDYEIGIDPGAYDQLASLLVERWGTESIAQLNLPSKAGDERFLEWYVRYVRSSATPRQAEANMREAREDDVRALLPKVVVPTLVMARSNHAAIPSSHGKYIADHIPKATFVEVPGSDGPFYWETPELILDHIERFVTGGVATSHARPETLTLLFTDIVGSTRMASERGDSGWSLLLSQHDDVVTKWIETSAGRVVKHMGDGVLAEFPSPSLALSAASSMANDLRTLGIEVRVGVHTAEVERRGDDLEGLGVVVARRIMESASGGEVLVSRAVRDLLAGSKVDFEDAGAHPLKGLDEEWHLYRYRG
jgi:class 3 adenylate cyclase/pimeloyl-ACP methyl ester carboxylesterase